MSLYFCCQWCMTGQFKQAQNKNISIALYWLPSHEYITSRLTLTRRHRHMTYPLTNTSPRDLPSHEDIATWLTLAQIHHLETYPHTKTFATWFTSHDDIDAWLSLTQRRHHMVYHQTTTPPHDFLEHKKISVWLFHTTSQLDLPSLKDNKKSQWFTSLVWNHDNNCN